MRRRAFGGIVAAAFAAAAACGGAIADDPRGSAGDGADAGDAGDGREASARDGGPARPVCEDAPLPGACRGASRCSTGDDCADGCCRYSRVPGLAPGPGACHRPGAALGNYCTTANDACHRDADCKPDETCQFFTDESRWKCGGGV